MKSKDVKVGGVYAAKVSGKLAKVRILRTAASFPGYPDSARGWIGQNELTGRGVRIRSAARLQYEIPGKEL